MTRYANLFEGQNTNPAPLDRVESTANDEKYFASDGALGVSTRINADTGNGEIILLEHRDLPQEPLGYNWYHLRTNGDGTWSREVDSINGNPEDLASLEVTSIAELTTPLGQPIHIMVMKSAVVNQSLRVLKIIAPGDIHDVPARLEEIDNPLPLDTDGDGIIDDLDNAKLRANHGQVNTNNDDFGDAMQANCSGNFPGIVGSPPGYMPGEGVLLPTGVSASGLRLCANSELGYEQVVSDEDGSTYHSNGGEVILAANRDILAQPEQVLRIIHSKDPRTPELPPRSVRLPDGNSVAIEFYDTSHVNGTPGTSILTGTGENGNPIRIVFNGPAARQNLGIIHNGLIVNEGGDFWLRLGNENPAPNIDVDASLLDGAVPPSDAGVDATALDAASFSDVAVLDASRQADLEIDATVVDASVDATSTPVCIPTQEICDDIDNNCDGVVDNEENGDPIMIRVENACDEMIRVCVGGVFYPSTDLLQQPEDEQCNAIDDDCDGQIDENVDRSCESECGNLGVVRCVDGEFSACDASACPPAQDAGLVVALDVGPSPLDAFSVSDLALPEAGPSLVDAIRSQVDGGLPDSATLLPDLATLTDSMSADISTHANADAGSSLDGAPQQADISHLGTQQDGGVATDLTGQNIADDGGEDTLELSGEPSSASEHDSHNAGCGCRVGETPNSSSNGLGVAAIALMVVAKRRRRQQFSK